MKFIILTIFVSLIFFYTSVISDEPKDENLGQMLDDEGRYGSEWSSNNRDCDIIHRQCYRKYLGNNGVYTDEEVQTAGKWVQQQFIRYSDIKPQEPPCKRFYVRKNWKCLSRDEKIEYFKVFREMFRNGDMNFLADIHKRWWPATHKAAQIDAWHRRYIVEFERRMQRINPNVAAPYWEILGDFDHPEMSIIFKDFGSTGNHTTGYCVTDGMFRNLNIPRCMKRQWYYNKYPSPFPEPICDTHLVQCPDLTCQFTDLFGSHWVPHLSIGEWFGDHSTDYAPYDLTFFFWHANNEKMGHKYQLRNKSHLAPLDYNMGFDVDWRTGQTIQANLLNPMAYWVNETIISAYQWTFGQYCYMWEDFIRPLNEIARGETNHVPVAVRRLVSTVPKPVLNSFGLDFDIKNYRFWDSHYPEIPDGTNKDCKPIPLFEQYNDTYWGQRQFGEFLTQGVSQVNAVAASLADLRQPFFIQLEMTLNKYRYCSPYVC